MFKKKILWQCWVKVEGNLVKRSVIIIFSIRDDKGLKYAEILWIKNGGLISGLCLIQNQQNFIKSNIYIGVGGWGITEKREKVKNNRVSSLVYWVDNVNEN